MYNVLFAVEIFKVTDYDGDASVGWVVRGAELKTKAVIAALPPEHSRRGDIVLPPSSSAMAVATVAASLVTAAEGGPNALAPLIAMAWGKR